MRFIGHLFKVSCVPKFGSGNVGVVSGVAVSNDADDDA